MCTFVNFSLCRLLMSGGFFMALRPVVVWTCVGDVVHCVICLVATTVAADGVATHRRHALHCAPSNRSFIVIGNSHGFAHTLCNKRSNFHLRADSMPRFTFCLPRVKNGLSFSLRRKRRYLSLGRTDQMRSHCHTNDHVCRVASLLVNGNGLAVATLTYCSRSTTV